MKEKHKPKTKPTSHKGRRQKTFSQEPPKGKKKK